MRGSLPGEEETRSPDRVGRATGGRLPLVPGVYGARGRKAVVACCFPGWMVWRQGPGA